VPRYDADWIDSMLKEARRGAPPAEDTLREIGLQRGEVIADVGCGPGFFTIPALRVVSPSGWVHALDREPSMLSLVQQQASEEGLDHLQTHLVESEGIPLANAVADLTICSLLLHDLDQRESFVTELARITRPLGRIAIIEWVPEPSETRKNRLSPELTAILIERTGRKVQINRQIGPLQYLVVAQ